MVRHFLVLMIFLFAFLQSEAQSDTLKKKHFDHYLGIQANQLVKEIINLGSATENTNPYFLTYGMYHIRRKVGIELGAGLNYQTLQDKDSPVNRSNRINEMSIRAGIGKKMPFGKQVVAGIALDFVSNSSDNNTEATSEASSFGTTIVNTSKVSSKSSGIGGGPRLSLNVNITKKILVGTEATYYFVQTHEKQHIFNETIIRNTISSTVTITNTDESPRTTSSRFGLGLPVVLFMILKF